MKLKPIYVFLGIILLLVLIGGCSYNGINSARLDADEKFANVQNNYQRRADLIPNIVATVKGAADFEKSTLQAVVEARAKATSIQVNANDMTPEKMQQYQAAQGQLSQALGRLLMVSENYPQLKTNENFLQLQSQLESTENRINESRRQYNESVKVYNGKVTSFPNNLLSGMFGFKSRDMFQADAAAKDAPKVQF